MNRPSRYFKKAICLFLIFVYSMFPFSQKSDHMVFFQASAAETEETQLINQLKQDQIEPLQEYAPLSDISKPEIDLSTLSVSQKTAVPGDAVTIRVKATDVGTGVDRVYFSIKTEGVDHSYKLIYTPDGEGYYNFTFTVKDTTKPGLWKLQSLSVYDETGNYTSYSYNNFDLSAGDFEVINPSGDTTAPTVDLSTLSVSQKTAVPGDAVTIRVKATDVGTGVDRVYFSIKTEGVDHSYKLIYTPDGEGYYNFTFTVKDTTKPGLWKLQSLSVYDETGNYTSYSYNNFDLSAGDFEVINPSGDTTAPTVDLSTLSVSQKTAVPGDAVTIRVKATDVGTGVDRVYFSIKTEGVDHSYKLIYTPDGEGYYNFTFTVKDTTKPGLWKLQSLSVYDETGNYTSYSYNNFDLSAGDFEVMDSTIPQNLIDVEVVTSNTTWYYKTINRDVYVGPEAILTIDGDVKINGNIYVLGAVVSYGDLTAKSVYANSSYFGYSSKIYQGSFNMRSGNHSVSEFVITSQPIPKIPIEVYSDNTVNENEVLPILEGATLPIGDLYIDGSPIEYYRNGSFRIQDYFVGSRTSIEIKVIDIYGKQHILNYDLNNLNQLESIKVENYPNNRTYYVGEPLDISGLTVEGTCLNGKKKSIQVSESQVTGFDSSKPYENQVLTVEVDGKTTTFTVNILANPVTALEISKLPDKLSYIEGQILDLTGLEVTATYMSGKIGLVDITEENVTGFDSSVPVNGQTITITYEGKEAIFTVDIIERKLESIEITQLPEKLEYVVGQNLILGGLEVTGTYNDGKQEVLPIDLSYLSGFSSVNPQESQELTVTVEGKTASFTVKIIPRALATIEITKMPADLEYIVGQSIDLSGLEVTGTYNDGTQEVLMVTIDNITGFDSSIPETDQVITITVEGKTVTFEVSIIEALRTIAGANRYGTAVEISKASYTASDVAILVQARNFPDALAAGPLAFMHNAPILLTNTDIVSGTTLSELERLGVTKVILMGGENAISAFVETSLRNKGYEIERIAGSNRYNTAVLTARSMEEKLGRRNKVVMASGNQFADALAAGSYAAKEGYPILLTNGTTLNTMTREYLEGIEEVILVGGSGVISEEVRVLLEGMNIKVTRKNGANRSETSTVIGRDYFGGSTKAVIANGWEFADALAAAPYAAKINAPIILVHKERVHSSVSEHIAASMIENIIVVGGEGAISQEVRLNLTKLIE